MSVASAWSICTKKVYPEVDSISNSRDLNALLVISYILFWHLTFKVNFNVFTKQTKNELTKIL